MEENKKVYNFYLVLNKCQNCKIKYEVYLKMESGADISPNPGFCSSNYQFEWNKLENKRNRKIKKIIRKSFLRENKLNKLLNE